MKQLVCLAMGLLVISTGRVSAEGKVLSFDELDATWPVLLEQTPMKYPTGAQAQGIEGWVLLAYTVKADGTTDDIRIVERTIPRVFDEPSIDWAADSRYTPALRDGEPVPMTVHRRHFYILRGEPNTVTPYFQRLASLTNQSLAEGDTEKAWKRIEKLDERRQLTLSELAFLDLLKSMAYEQSGNLDEALAHAERALIVADKTMDASSQEHLLRHALSLNTRTVKLAASLKTYDALVELKGSLPPDDPARRVAEEIRSIIDGSSALEVEAQLLPCATCEPGEGSHRWYHVFAREQFRFDALSGSPNNARLDCDERTVEFVPVSGETYQLPPNAQYCRLWVYADSPMNFNVLELPDASEAIESAP